MLPEKLLMDITQFAFNDRDEWEVAVEEFHESLHNAPTEEEVESFEIDYVFSRKHSVHKKTFIRLFVECFEELYGKEWSREILSLDENFEGFFEIVKDTQAALVVTDLILGDTLEIQHPSVDYQPRKGDILSGRVFKWKGQFYFFGSLGVIGEKYAIQNTKAFTFRTRKACENATNSFLEYFGKNVVIFRDRRELEEKLNEFIYWFFRNKAPPGVLEEGEELRKLTFEELEDKKEIGLIIDFSLGQRVIAEYGYAQALLTGKWEEVPGYSERMKELLYTDEIPSHLVKDLIEEHSESSVELYSKFFPVKTKEDLLELFSRFRRDWGRTLRRQSMLLER